MATLKGVTEVPISPMLRLAASDAESYMQNARSGVGVRWGQTTLNKSDVQVVTARIRRMGEGNIFSLFTLAGGGTLSQVCKWGVPCPRSGRVPYPRSRWWGVCPYPQSGLDGGGTWGTPQSWDGVPYPPTDLGWGTPHPDMGWGIPPHQVWMMGGVPGH